MSRSRNCRTALLATALLAATAAAGLDLGQTAKEPQYGAKLKGEPVTRHDAARFQLLTVYFFWTPGCRPCQRSIPVLNELEQKYRGKLAVVGVGIGTLEELARSPLPEAMNFPVVADPARLLLNDFLRAGDRVPCVAVLDPAGRFLWRGEVAQLDKLIELHLAGKFDAETAARIDRRTREYQEALQRQDYPRALKALEAELEFQPDNLELIVRKARLLAERLERPGEATQTLEQALTRLPRAYPLYETWFALLRTAGDDSGLREAAGRLVRAYADQPELPLDVLRLELRRPVSDFSFPLVRALLEALAANAALTPEQRAELQELAARYAYLTGQPELAVQLQSGLPADDRTPAALRTRRQQDLNYYRAALEASRQPFTLQGAKP